MKSEETMNERRETTDEEQETRRKKQETRTRTRTRNKRRELNFWVREYEYLIITIGILFGVLTVFLNPYLFALSTPVPCPTGPLSMPD